MLELSLIQGETAADLSKDEQILRLLQGLACQELRLDPIPQDPNPPFLGSNTPRDPDVRGCEGEPSRSFGTCEAQSEFMTTL